jgi:Icc protein
MAHGSNERAAVLLQLTDTHFLAALDGQLHGVTTQRTFDAVLNHVKEHSKWPPDAIAVTGDIVQDESRAGYQRFRETFQSFGLPILCIPGNHDNPSLMIEFLAAPPFQLCGDAKLGAWRVLLLSTFQQGDEGGRIGADQLAGLEESLSKHSDEHVIICMHHQPLLMGSAWLDGVGLRDAQDFLDVVDRHQQVRAVLWGHVHQASDRVRNGVRFLSTPSTCFQFLPDSDRAAIDTRPPALRWLDLEPDGNVTTTVDWVDTESRK